MAHCDLQDKLCVYLETVTSIVPISRSLRSHLQTDNLAYVLCLMLVYRKTLGLLGLSITQPPTDPDAFKQHSPQWTVPPGEQVCRLPPCLPESDGNAG